MVRKLILLLFPVFSFTQINDSNGYFNHKFFFSTDFGFKFYSGNLFLDQQNYSREGVYFNFNMCTQKKVNTTTFLVKSSFNLSNAISKKIRVITNFNHLYDSNYFTTNIPNILSCNINISFYLSREINQHTSHSLGLKFLIQPLFYKKGNIFGGEISSFGALISSEENGSLSGLEKPFSFCYQIKYAINKKSVIKFKALLKSDFKLNSQSDFKLYPGLAINFEKLISISK